MNRRLTGRILSLTLPAIVANVATPLMSMSDMAMAGRLGHADFIAAVAMGGVIFNLAYWLLGFLRMGTSGLTAQAYGRRDRNEVAGIAMRSVTLGAALGMAMILLQVPFIDISVNLMDAEGDVRRYVSEYCRICIWGAPAVLVTNSFAGWYVGQQNSTYPMIVTLVTVALNIAISYVLVFHYDMDTGGLAYGTMTAQWTGVGMYIAKTSKLLHGFAGQFHDVFDINRYLLFFRINIDIFIRTLFMVAVTFWFTRTGSHQGAVVLAANALLMQLFTLFSYFIDGFAYAAEGICGELAGAENRKGLSAAIRRLYLLGFVMAGVFMATYMCCGQWIINLLSEDVSVNDKAVEYLGWAAIVPLVGFGAFIGDGIAVGLVRTRLMLLSVAVGAIVFFAVYVLAFPALGNHGLWLAFVSYLAVRSVLLGRMQQK